MGVVILGYGLYFNEDKIIKLALVTFIVMALITIPIYLSGEEAEETMEQIVKSSEPYIEEHEEHAEMAIWLMGLLGFYALFNYYMVANKSKLAKTFTFVTLLISITTFGLFAQLGNLGGQIRHTEIRSDNTNLPADDKEELDDEDE
jgi:uncharacterized membrane protein